MFTLTFLEFDRTVLIYLVIGLMSNEKKMIDNCQKVFSFFQTGWQLQLTRNIELLCYTRLNFSQQITTFEDKRHGEEGFDIPINVWESIVF